MTVVEPASGSGPTSDEAAGQHAAPLTVAVLGSCITRDNFNSRFNADYRRWYRPVLTHNQASIISVMSEPTPIAPDELGTQGSDHDRAGVRDDFDKSFLRRLQQEAPDYLVVDFFGDVHFGVLDLGEGRYVTNNRWKLWPTPWFRGLEARGPLPALRLDQEPERYLELWTDAFDRLVSHVRAVTPRTTVVIHRGRNTGTLRLPGGAGTVPLLEHRNLARIDVRRYNQLWRRLDDHACTYDGFRTVDLTAREYPTTDDHPWGPYYVHYAMDYYADFLRELHKIHLGRGVSGSDPVAASMLEQLLGAADERWREVVRRKEAVIARQGAALAQQQRRIEQLEGRAPEIVGRKVMAGLGLRRPRHRGGSGADASLSHHEDGRRP